jgi:hypothetical protein
LQIKAAILDERSVWMRVESNWRTQTLTDKVDKSPR